MRIGNFAQVQALYNTNKPAKTNTAKAKGFSDAVSISGAGKDLAAAKAAVSNAPDVRAELVDSIKERIKNGTYDVDADSFAEKIFEKFA